VSVQGRLSDIHYAKTSGNQVRAIVANVETDDGRRRPVLIGAQQALGGSADTLYDGAYVNFSGRRGRAYNGEAEFVVTGIYVEQPSSGYVVQAAPRTYEVYEAPRTYEVYTAPRTYAAGRGTTQFFRGEIATLDERDVNGREHYIAELEIGDDRYIRVDLGPKEQLDELDMESGDEIQVQGYRGTLLGRSMLLATFVEGDDGETATISRDQYGNIRNTWVQEED
jgi:hypothetical protein